MAEHFLNCIAVVAIRHADAGEFASIRQTQRTPIIIGQTLVQTGSALAVRAPI